MRTSCLESTAVTVLQAASLAAQVLPCTAIPVQYCRSQFGHNLNWAAHAIDFRDKVLPNVGEPALHAGGEPVEPPEDCNNTKPAEELQARLAQLPSSSWYVPCAVPWQLLLTAATNGRGL